MRIALLTVIGVLMFGVPSGSTQSGPPCTAGASSVVVGQEPVTTWYPPGCIHP
jgi:hypothetical protein